MPASGSPVLAEAYTEARRLFQIGLPLMGAQLCQMGMGVADAVMAGQYGSADLAGVALGGSIMFPVLLLMMGMIQAVTPTISQLHGAKDYQEIGEVMRQGLWLAITGGLLGSLILNNIEPAYRWLGVDPVAVEIAVPYLQMTSMGFPALICFFCLRFLADGTGYTRAALIIAACALTLKIPLNYILIYGLFGLPELGGVGCGAAQAIVMWTQFLLILAVVTRRRFRYTRWAERFSWPDWQRIKPLLVIGIPIGAMIFAEMGLFSLTTLLMGRLGAEVVAAHNITMNVNGILFMIPLALGMAATIRIGHRVGAGDILDARMTAAIAMGATVLVGAVSAVAILLLRHTIVAIYTSEAPVSSVAAVLLLFVAFYLILDATQATAAGALRGYKDTRVPMMIALFSYWAVAFPIECILGFGLIGKPLGYIGFWIGLSCGVGTSALLLSIRLWRVSKNVSLIERLSGRLPRDQITERAAS